MTAKFRPDRSPRPRDKHDFTDKETFNFFESRGLPLVVEANKRAFPNTHKAADVVRVLKK